VLTVGKVTGTVKMFFNPSTLIVILMAATTSFLIRGATSFGMESGPQVGFNRSECASVLSAELKAEISGYKNTIDDIMRESMTGSFKSKVYSDLAYFLDAYGSRPSGSKALEVRINTSPSCTYLPKTGGPIDSFHFDIIDISGCCRIFEF